MDFRQLDVTWDRGLSEAQKKEWNAIYASCRSGSILTGKITGMDSNVVSLTDPENGRQFDREVFSLVVIDYRVKVLIPEREIWFDEKSSQPTHVLRSMGGDVMDYVVTDIDKEEECCVASRRQAMRYRRYTFQRDQVQAGDKATARILAVGYSHILAECYGYDMTLSMKDVSYTVMDLHERYRPGDECPVVIKGYDKERDQLAFSLKEVEPHPFEGVEIRHPIGSRRASFITGKYKGGVFCRLDDNMDCLCTYSAGQCDEDFHVGDPVMVVISKYSYEKKLVYAKIIAKW